MNNDIQLISKTSKTAEPDVVLIKADSGKTGQTVTIKAQANSTYELRNPATGDLLVELPRCHEAETDRAIEAADRAFRVERHACQPGRSDLRAAHPASDRPRPAAPRSRCRRAGGYASMPCNTPS